MPIFSRTPRRDQRQNPAHLIGVMASEAALSQLDPKALDAPNFLRAERIETRKDALGRFLDAEAALILVLGSDALVGEVITLYRRYFSAHRTPLRLAVMAAGAVHGVADTLGAGAPTPRGLKQLTAALEQGALQRRRLPTLKITSSARPASQYGFTWGAGLFYDIFEGLYRGGARRSGGILAATSLLSGVARRVVTDGSAAFKPVQARVSVDGQAHAEQFGFWVAGSLELGWFGLRLGAERACFRSGDSPGELLAQISKSQAVPGFLRAMRAGGSEDCTPFERIQMDASTGYVLDGELFDPDRAYTLQIKPGEPALFYTI